MALVEAAGGYEGPLRNDSYNPWLLPSSYHVTVLWSMFLDALSTYDGNTRAINREKVK